jgi:hypothetical protein
MRTKIRPTAISERRTTNAQGTIMRTMGATALPARSQRRPQMRSIRRSIVIAGTLGALGVLSPPMSASPSNRHLLLTKTCDDFAVSHRCTVMTSEEGPIPVGTEAVYTGPVFANRVSSRVVLTTPGNDTATGHCTLSYQTGLGRCAFTGGTGVLAGFHANVEVTLDLETLITTWDGTYHFIGRD